MFQSAAIPQHLHTKEFSKRVPDLRAELLKIQHKLRDDKAFSTLILVGGLDGAGKGAAISRLFEWMDNRYLFCNAYQMKATEEERLRPYFWRYWRDLPARGETAIVFGSWYQAPMREAVKGELDDDAFERELAAINRFERMLAYENVLLLKFWFTLPKDEQKKRLEAVAASKHKTRHFLEEWTDLKHHKKALVAGEKVALHTSTGFAPWIVIPATDPHYRDLAVGETILAAMNKRHEQHHMEPVSAPAIVSGITKTSAVDAIDLTETISKSDYKKEVEHWQGRLAELTDHKKFQKISLVSVFQGNDAAGKGGSIRRVTQALDPRNYKVYPIAAPTEEEKLHPYLWRFWRRLPRKGHIAIFDRSWYERVLVERVEGFCSEADWMRAYNEINSFEAELADFGIVICKFWLAISEEEQLQRFKAREETAYKNYKITEEDWRNRLKWDQYATAAGDMVDRTSTRYAPWTLVSSQDKRNARVKVLEQHCKALERAMFG
ncbi:polyphosphate:AMP phosphotransferase [Pseudovibrio exalbescens]|uniref:polyphosphate:AMP phosphotransferase n=1 Tax=Pseudovibrio exalbescens TaxID=197461 RepID=UPI0023652C82|nr:polyphosphate:AMP phosphotransferase [Pseudovibrio exalbescens]MDD7909593.1 polyphosphate:AMP phosphotransferase [Pseudovibrio exalbescens]